MDNLAALRAEYARDRIGSLLHDLLSKIVWSTAREYPPAEYSVYRNWDRAACEDILHDWVADRLCGRADLAVMLTSAPNVAQLRSALTTSLRQFLTNKRRRTLASNLYKRVAAMLQNDSQFIPVASAASVSDQLWSIAGTDGRCSKLSVEDLVRIAFELSDDHLQVVRYGPFSQKLSPILRDGKLREFLHFVLSKANGALTVTTIIEVMRFRFSLTTEENTELEDSIPSPLPSPASEAEATLAARSIISRLNSDESQILAEYFKAGGDFTIAAQNCGRGLERVRTVVRRAFVAICDSSDSEEHARSIMVHLESSLLQRGGV